MTTKYQGHVVNRLTGERLQTRKYRTLDEAYTAAEQLRIKKFGKADQDHIIRVYDRQTDKIQAEGV